MPLDAHAQAAAEIVRLDALCTHHDAVHDGVRVRRRRSAARHRRPAGVLPELHALKCMTLLCPMWRDFEHLPDSGPGARYPLFPIEDPVQPGRPYSLSASFFDGNGVSTSMIVRTEASPA